MLKKRLIPVLFLKNGFVVRSKGFVDFREFGNPTSQLERLNDWIADELIYVDITRDGIHDLKRDDHKVTVGGDTLAVLKEISKKCFMPLTFGGRIRSFEQAAMYISGGADKVLLNSFAYENPSLIKQIADTYGSQCVVVGIDVKKKGDAHQMYIHQGTKPLDIFPEEWAKKAVDMGAGEIFLNSIDRDGSGSGYDLAIIEKITKAVSIPVIACGGAGTFDDFEEVYLKTNASAVAAGNIFNYTENAYLNAKRHLTESHCPVKPVYAKTQF